MTFLLRHVILQISGHRAINVHAHILFRVQEYKWSMLQFTETTTRLGRTRQAEEITEGPGMPISMPMVVI